MGLIHPRIHLTHSVNPPFEPSLFPHPLPPPLSTTERGHRLVWCESLKPITYGSLLGDDHLNAVLDPPLPGSNSTPSLHNATYPINTTYPLNTTRSQHNTTHHVNTTHPLHNTPHLNAVLDPPLPGNNNPLSQYSTPPLRRASHPLSLTHPSCLHNTTHPPNTAPRHLCTTHPTLLTQ